jgi:hypothetical protein
MAYCEKHSITHTTDRGCSSCNTLARADAALAEKQDPTAALRARIAELEGALAGAMGTIGSVTDSAQT